jgi:hypothetical protein
MNPTTIIAGLTPCKLWSWSARLGGQQLHLRAGVVQDVGGHRVPLGVVAVQQPLRCPAADLGQFPAEVDRVLDAEVKALPTGSAGGCAPRRQLVSETDGLGEGALVS